MRYLVTGGAGFIGSHLTEALLARGDSVVALDDLSTGQARNVEHLSGRPDFELVSGSVLDETVVDRLVSDCDVVLHLAAAAGVKLIVDRPMHALTTNIDGTENVLKSVLRHDKRFLLASSSEVYGKQSGKIHELVDRIIGPTSISRWAFATSKAADEFLAFAYSREQQVPTIIVRFFNTVGPRQTGRYGMVLPRLVAQALLGQDLTIFGDGSQSRCYCDVEDSVRAVLALLDEPKALGDVFNVGSEEEISVRDLGEKIIQVTGSSSSLRFVPHAEYYGPYYEDITRRVPDTSKIRGLIGWTPQHDLTSVIKKAAAYAQDVGPQTLLGD